MKTPAIIATATIAGSIAFAAGQQSGGKQSPPMPSGAQAHSMQEEMPQARMERLIEGCAPPSLANWLSPEPIEVPCSSQFATMLTASNATTGSIDIDGDGKIEYCQVTAISRDIVVGGTPNPGGISIRFNRWLTSTGVIEIVDVPIVPNDFASRLSETRFSGCTNVTVYIVNGVDSFGSQIAGWRDMDNDGDLDYIIFVRGETANTSTYGQFWFENTGYEKPAPTIAADLNGDGQVNGADLGLLLVAWGPNP
jgi:hypothetical protein